MSRWGGSISFQLHWLLSKGSNVVWTYTLALAFPGGRAGDSQLLLVPVGARLCPL